jgi:hypothetical protein
MLFLLSDTAVQSESSFRAVLRAYCVFVVIQTPESRFWRMPSTSDSTLFFESFLVFEGWCHPGLFIDLGSSHYFGTLETAGDAWEDKRSRHLLGILRFHLIIAFVYSYLYFHKAVLIA